MRLAHVLVPALLLTTAFAALAPAADAAALPVGPCDDLGGACWSDECFDFFGALPICWQPPQPCLRVDCLPGPRPLLP